MPNGERSALVADRTHACGIRATTLPGEMYASVNVPRPPPHLFEGRNDNVVSPSAPCCVSQRKRLEVVVSWTVVALFRFLDMFCFSLYRTGASGDGGDGGGVWRCVWYNFEVTVANIRHS